MRCIDCSESNSRRALMGPARRKDAICQHVLIVTEVHVKLLTRGKHLVNVLRSSKFNKV
jgi:hypothetical protein